MTTITIGTRSFRAPIFVPSISSFETQLKPASALRLQYTLREPISLVSAYDVANDPELIKLCKAFREQGVLLLDSGGYESSRISRYSTDPEGKRWNFEKYSEIASNDIYDYIFSFDYFPKREEPVREFRERILKSFREHADVLDIEKLIPVIHIQTKEGDFRFNDGDAVDLFGYIAGQIECYFVSVPERELGQGIINRTNLARLISRRLRQSDCHLHVLGCGNLLSLSLLTVAGVTMCDGLEWCRTFAATDFHLHHFQQKDLFADPNYYSRNPVAEYIFKETQLDYQTQVAVRNLLSFQVFADDLQNRLEQFSINEFVRSCFGDVAGDAVRGLEA
jgi:hypothetical protein